MSKGHYEDKYLFYDGQLFKVRCQGATNCQCHSVSVGGGNGGGDDEANDVMQLPRQPLIVLRYIIYWPDEDPDLEK